MLWAQFQPKNEVEAAALVVGVVIAGLMSGGIPFFTGLAMKQVGLGVAGGVVSGLAGALAGCCLGIPVALIFTAVIVVVANFRGQVRQEPQFPRPIVDDYDDYARPFRLPPRPKVKGGIPWAEECGDEPQDDLSRRAEERRNRNRPFRSRPPKDDLDDRNLR